MTKAQKLSTADVLHLAKLARLELTPAEVALYTHQLGDVLSYVGKLQDLKTTALAAGVVEPVALRADEVSAWLEPAALIKQAPQNHDNLVEVPAVFGDRE